MRVITISPALNGWIMEIGCSKVVFDDLGTMLVELGKYIESPSEVEEEYLSVAKNRIPIPRPIPRPE